MAEDEPAGEPPPGEGPPRRRLPWPARIGPILHGLGVAWVIAGVATTQLGPLGGFLSAAIGVVLSRRGLRTDLERHQEVLPSGSPDLDLRGWLLPHRQLKRYRRWRDGRIIRQSITPQLEALTAAAIPLAELADPFLEQRRYLDLASWRTMRAELEVLLGELAQLEEAVGPYEDLVEGADGLRQLRGLIAPLEALLEDRTETNRRFVAAELEATAGLLDAVGPTADGLDDDQRRAVVRDDLHNLVIAGAGSGKTLVLVARVIYLLQRQRVAPEDLLVVCFNRAAAAEVSERLSERYGVADVEVRTLHSWARQVIDDTAGDVPEVYQSSDRDLMLAALLDGTATEVTPALRGAILQLFAHWSLDSTEDRPLPDPKLRMEALEARGYETIQGEQVRSQAEKLIADTLYLNGVSYTYESRFSDACGDGRRLAEEIEQLEFRQQTEVLSKADELALIDEIEWHREQLRALQMWGQDGDRAVVAGTSQYRPDFSIDGTDIILEHFGIGADGGVDPSWDTTTRMYHEQMVWKRGVCERWGCTLIETYQFEHTAGRLDRAVLARVRAAGVTTSPREPDVVLRELEHRIRIREPLRDRLGSFIDLARSTRRPPEAIRAHTRGASRLVRLFTEVGLEALAIYEGRLEQRGEIDFTDMIDWADRLIDEGRASPRYDHVLVDEFQDINPAEFALIEGLVDAADAHLFVVGDDWQSITSFRGAMIGQIIGFDDAHEGVATTPLGRSYRLPDTVAAAGASLIAQNTAQLDKRVDPIRGVAGRIRVHEIAAEGPLYRDLLVERTAALIERTLAAEDTGAPGAIMVLCRYDSAVSTLDAIRGKLRAMGIDYTDISELSEARMHPVLIGTVHSAKGMEADRVIIVDVGEGRMGFPPTDRRRDLLMGVMPEPERWAADDGGEATGHPAIEEERRLFYVALTRARSSVDILAPRTRPSRFIAEIEEHVGRVAATHGIAAIDPEGTPLPLLVRVRDHEGSPHPKIDQRGVLEDGGGTVAFISWRSDPIRPLAEGTWYRISGHRTDTFRDRPQVVLDADTEVLELDAIPERVEPASIEPCEPSSWGSEVEDLLKQMGAKGDVDLWVSAPEIDLMWRLAVKTKEELRSELEISEADAEVLGTAARAHTGVVPTVIDEIVATTGASKQEVLEHLITEAGSGTTAPDMRAALLKRFEATA